MNAYVFMCLCMCEHTYMLYVLWLLPVFFSHVHVVDDLKPLSFISDNWNTSTCVNASEWHQPRRSVCSCKGFF